MQTEQVVDTSEHQRLVRIVALTCGSRTDAEDAVQDAYVASLQASVAPANLSAWIVTVATRRTVGGWRRRQSEKRSWARAAEAHPVESDVDRLIDLRTALRSLSTRQLEVVNLYYFLGLSIDETARQLNISGGTVKKALSRAREALRRALEVSR